ncbi:sensor histidine kinase [Puniceibacterium sediminis]|uniref:histidine kinase n=1 Tax=Puniceibacterium sediminis TaxID=1608407 RepID=A0A238Y542_9RHOB|nr:sensor histidine kinase [Puniceibacterium sediminis]SNR66130.1 Signal transduction histidine kinase [Puniceibacterium sediminis]
MSDELFVSLATNIGLLAICAILVTIIAASITSRLPGASKEVFAHNIPYFGVIAGLVFGLTSAALILSSHNFQSGVILDSRAGPVILSGVFGGPVAAVVTFVIGGIARAWVGGPYVIGGVASIAIYAASGIFLVRWLKIDISKTSWASYGTLILFGIVGTIAVIPAFFMNQGQEMATVIAAITGATPILLIQNSLAVLLLGSALKTTLMVIQDHERLGLLSRDLDDANKKLCASNKNLEESNRKLSDFSNMAAHDLKAPIRGISNLINFILEDLRDLNLSPSDDFIENTELVQSKLVGMNALVEDLLSYSFTTERRADAQSFNPNDRIQHVMMQIGAHDGYTIKVDAPFPQAFGSPAAFDIVIRNLLSNAIKHHDQPSGSISVSAHQENDAVIFEISDDGPGIPEESLEVIFKPFQTLSSKDEVPGSGLGLSFVRKLVESWGGSISALSPNARGSTFRFTIPVP